VSIVSSLTERGLISSDQVQIGLTESESTGKSLEQTLVDLGFVSGDLLRDVKGAEGGADSIDLSSALPDPNALEEIPEQFARSNAVVPVSADNGCFRVALVDIQNLHVIDKLQRQLGSRWQLQLLIASERDIADALDRFYGFDLSIDGILREIEAGNGQSRITDIDNGSYRHPFVRLVDAILLDAVKRGASDIHFEPEGGFLRVRFRTDGLLHQIRSLHISYWPAMVVRLKVLAGLDIAESRAPQDGRISFKIAGGSVEFRVSVLPTIHGENIVLRILDKEKGIVPLERLGLTDESLALLNSMMQQPEGLILVTGPTGSGKTTTLYSLLDRISSEHINIMTMEDPVEYPLPLLRQTSVNDQVKLDFATGIRAILRQDPDVILVGEVRDVETARMALRASMTGHQVYSTLHANSAVGALLRLQSLGVSKDELSGNLIGIIGQRLVRKLCVHCKQSVEQAGRESSVAEPVGCHHCDWQGYKGREVVVEILKITAELESLFLAGASPASLKTHAIKKGFKPMADDAQAKINSGVTSFSEASRVIDLSEAGSACGS
jgi:type II secretory ATPase GspE/PulE/Tfp pilus assembly ATPase PilB-like protein